MKNPRLQPTLPDRYAPVPSAIHSSILVFHYNTVIQKLAILKVLCDFYLRNFSPKKYRKHDDLLSNKSPSEKFTLLFKLRIKGQAPHVVEKILRILPWHPVCFFFPLGPRVFMQRAAKDDRFFGCRTSWTDARGSLMSGVTTLVISRALQKTSFFRQLLFFLPHTLVALEIHNRFRFGVHTPLIATQSARAGDLWMFVFETMSLNLDLATSTWNPKQPFIKGCWVKQPFSM